MTIQDIRVKFFRWFEENNSFEINRDYLKFMPIVEDPSETRAAVIESLKDLEEYKLVRKCEGTDKGEKRDYYVLVKSMASYEQSVSLGSPTATYVAATINNFCDFINDHRDVADPAEIKEKDIQNLVHIIAMLEKKEIDNKLDEM